MNSFIKINIDPIKETVSLEMSPDITWNIALRSLAATIRTLAYKTCDAVFNAEPWRKKQIKGQRAALRDEIKGDLADEINFAISNILNELAPKSPDSELTETAIATLENEIIHYAQDNHLPLSKAIKDYQSLLAHSSAYAAKEVGQNAPIPELNPDPAASDT